MIVERNHALSGLPWVVLAVDIAVLTLVGVVAVLGREQMSVFTTGTDLRDDMHVAGPLILLGWLLTLALLGSYRPEVLGAGIDEYKRVLNASLVAAGLTGVGCYLAKFALPRGFFVLAFVLGPLLLLWSRWVTRQVLHTLRRRGRLQVRVLVAGTPDSIDAMAQLLRRESWLGYAVVGAMTPTGDLVEETPSGIPVAGSIDRLTDIAAEHVADLVVFASGSFRDPEEIKEAIWALEHHHVHVAIAPRVDNISHERITIRPVGGMPLMHIDSPTWADAGALGKRAFDVVAAAALVVALAPIFAVAALAVWRHDRGPVFFRQPRVGRNGESFRCWKFRTMRVDAEAAVKRLQQESDQGALLFKLKDDPRVTRPGRWLRRFSIDELPQLFNVLRGDMSLVGPRPQVDREVALYRGAMGRRLLVRPGMTGLWQVSGRSDLSPEEAMRLDLYYVDNWSMMQDLAILGRTVRAVVGSHGAY